MNVALFGFMAVGKTTVGRLLAKRLDSGFVDTDEEVERTAGMRIPEIFSILGESEFRRIEARVVRRVASLEEHVIALGGGAVVNAMNVELLRRSSCMIFLTASPKELLLRAGPGASRPLLGVEDRLARIRRLLNERRNSYFEAADMVIDTNGRSPIGVTDAIIARLEAYS